MYKFIVVFLCSIVLHCFESKGQVVDYETSQRERIKFSNTLDSLFLEQKYRQIIDLCNRPQPNYLSATCTYNLIGTYYFLGDSLKSWELLNKEIDKLKSNPDAGAYSIDNIFSTGAYTSFKKFQIKSSVKNYVHNIIDTFYKTELVTDMENGAVLLHLLLEDQWVRRTTSLYDKLFPERRFPLPSIMDSTLALQRLKDHCTIVFKFYKERI